MAETEFKLASIADSVRETLNGLYPRGDWMVTVSVIPAGETEVVRTGLVGTAREYLREDFLEAVRDLSVGSMLAVADIHNDIG